VLLTIRLANRWFGPRAAFLAGVWVTCDPLLIHNTALPMTESLFTLLFVALFNTFDCPGIADSPPATTGRRITQGTLFGLCALCRPTVWVFGILWGAAALFAWRKHPSWSGALRRAVIPVVAALVVVSPWIIRNAVALRAWIPMTTHG